MGKQTQFALLASAMAILTYGTAQADAAAPETAKPAAATASGDITVTARRRNEALQDVPLTVSAVSGETLHNLGINTIHDVVEMIPNAVIQDSPNNLNTFINIRGMQEVNTQAEPNVGLYRNGLYAGGERENLGAQVDIDRIEVLRGPQGGLLWAQFGGRYGRYHRRRTAPGFRRLRQGVLRLLQPDQYRRPRSIFR